MVNPFSRCGRWITERKFSPDWSLPDLEPGVIERLNRSLFNVIQAEDGDLDVKNYVEAQWTLLAQALYPSLAPVYPNSGEEVEAAAANKAHKVDHKWPRLYALDGRAPRVAPCSTSATICIHQNSSISLV
jgi:hypothetical protein